MLLLYLLLMLPSQYHLLIHHFLQYHRIEYHL
jgi:hypothetical protein